ncbi:hypothetical protein LQ327_10235 [Actinomycetospora endophytica]|uniref:Interferon-induced transmembrane protein n=1 Tax=Actinomycetospora endophytica TaxID=2291215 RepID=A0ABS8P663_9PSEU|nr:hypothetical protein [Actinomycetospora endophytica]MCD2193755.1 hypothetical protein [Actinomycetospora endophytica]
MTISVLWFLVPIVLLVVVGVWGWRNADALAAAMPLDERTKQKRRRVYLRGSVACLVVAVLFVVLIVVSFL